MTLRKPDASDNSKKGNAPEPFMPLEVLEALTSREKNQPLVKAKEYSLQASDPIDAYDTPIPTEKERASIERNSKLVDQLFPGERNEEKRNIAYNWLMYAEGMEGYSPPTKENLAKLTDSEKRLIQLHIDRHRQGLE